MKKPKLKQFKCPKCGNQRTESNCDYCNWKGDEGPGAQLKSLVKQESEGLNLLIKTFGLNPNLNKVR